MRAKTHTAGASPVRRGGVRPFRRRNLLLVLLALVAVIFVLNVVEIRWQDVTAWLEQVSRPVALALMATLPIVGFPISAVYLAAGALFGPGLGLLVVAAVTAVHLLATQVIAQTVLRRRIEHWRHEWSRRLPDVPPEENLSLVAMIVIVPGLPYIARNCLLALARVPLRLLLGVALPIYVLRSVTTIYLGGFGSAPSFRSLAVLGGIYGAKLAVSFLLFRRLKSHSRRPRRSHRSTKQALKTKQDGDDEPRPGRAPAHAGDAGNL